VKKMLAIAVTAATLGTTLVTGAVSVNHPAPTTEADCKDGGFAEYRISGMVGAPQRFGNQGQCFKVVNTGK
jgi:hypothetical protein